ncbi:glycosyltransferase [Alkalihalobacillus sp. LMS39]|uniref:MGDG synthase family glycosyltransferase n=1 Tax=Alkalihalobacillus sp. LMS39 TaxID=2924032 RepID=UPI001FB2AD6E|nr:glycosyltransferase [Alkalihalobacillus sp. LMS39]UOE93550.1 glycosyltransferase [Alkalihalobacillus sp. LMS39]
MAGPKVLILTGSYGNGHLQVTKTLEKTFRDKGITNIVTSDLFFEAHPLITKVTRYLYIKSFTYGQRIYGGIYYGTDKKKNSYITKVTRRLGMEKLDEIVQRENPDIIVNTFPMLVVPEYRKRKGTLIPIVTVVTDYCVHNHWIHEEVDTYYVSTNEIVERLKKSGILPQKVKVTGIPIQPSFEQKIMQESFLKTFNLSKTKPIILIIAGAFGVLQDLDQVVQEIQNSTDCQVVVICGKNKKLKQSLDSSFCSENDVKIIGYSNEIDKWMSVATVLVTKPGGITLSEALAVHVPLILFGCVPGQETENALYFKQKGIAEVVDSKSELITQITEIVTNDSKRKEMKQRMEQLYKGSAANMICDDIVEMLSSPSVQTTPLVIEQTYAETIS